MNFIVCGKPAYQLKAYHPHQHDDWEIIFQQEGDALITINEQEYSVCAGDVMVIPPKIVHSGKVCGTDEKPKCYVQTEDGCNISVTEEKTLYFTDSFFRVRETGFTGVIVAHDYDGSICKLMQMLYQTFVEKQLNYQKIAESLAQTILCYIERIDKKPEKYSYVTEMKNTMYQNLSKADFSIGVEIKKMGFHPDYFRRCFRETEGKTPLEYLTELRINHAKAMLIQQPFFGIEQVAFQCGFSDSFYFSRKFKQITGRSPLQYRKEKMK